MLTNVNQDGRLVILHLSDLHFGWEGNTKSKDDREIALQGLLSTLRGLDKDWKPDCVCITGDIGWKGKTDDYTLAVDWISGLLATLGLEPDALFICPGKS